jgi:hypothetical protein
MTRATLAKWWVLLASLLLLALPVVVRAETEAAKPAPPPIAQQLVREGDLAMKLTVALGLGTFEDETEAESKLGDVGIVPRNGWIADYPVTPDIIGELQKSVGDAAEAGKISLGKDEAVKKLTDVSTQLSLSVKPYTGSGSAEVPPAEAEKYPNQTVVNNYYYEQGPPVVTYYAPPPDYYYLYSWVPYPFWWFDFWFPGFFILNDFHRPFFFGHRVVFISNHFNDIRVNRVFRIDPVRRFNGRTFAGIGVVNRRGFVSTGVPRSDRRIFNAPRTRGWQGGAPGGTTFRGTRMGAPPSGGTRSFTAPPRGGGRMAVPPSGGRSFGAPSRGGGPSSFGGMRGGAPSVRGGGGAVRGGGGSSGRGERR